MVSSVFGTSVMEDNFPTDGVGGWLKNVSHKEHIAQSLSYTVHRRVGAPMRL